MSKQLKRALIIPVILITPVLEQSYRGVFDCLEFPLSVGFISSRGTKGVWKSLFIKVVVTKAFL